LPLALASPWAVKPWLVSALPSKIELGLVGEVAHGARFAAAAERRSLRTF
jgi:hypothetical protein